MYINCWIRRQGWELKEASDISPHVVFLHAMMADGLDPKGIERWLKDIRNQGLVPGCVTHKPARVLRVLMKSGLNIEAYMVSFNRRGIFMDCKPDALISILDSIEQPVIAKKTLAAGTVSPSAGLPFAARYAQIDGLALGLTSREEMNESLSLAVSNWPR